MKIVSVSNSPNFMRRLKSSEEAEYSDVLKRGKELVNGGGNSKSILIMPATSLPQMASNNTGVGILNSDEAGKFFDFSKKYWGINEVLLLPMGQYYSKKGNYPLYSGSSMDLGNHVINLKKYLPEDDFKQIVNNNKIQDKVNFENVVDKNSISEKMLKKLYHNMPQDLSKDFLNYKKNASQIIDRKSLYIALTEIYNTHDYKQWNELDKNLFNPDIVDDKKRDERIRELKSIKKESIDFYKFKQFLAEESLKDAKQTLNSKGIKLNGDIPCGYSYDEYWSHPKAFLQDYKLNWGLFALNPDSSEAEQILREKIRLASKRYDGFRVDAAWTYAQPKLFPVSPGVPISRDYGAKLLDIISDEVSKTKGANYDLKNIIYEFEAAAEDFNIHSHYDNLKPFVEERVKIYTSQYMSETWGHTQNFIDRGWGEDMFVIGAMNHDSAPMVQSEKQANVLARLFRVPKEQLSDITEFIKYKLAEPMRAKNNMLFFMPALNMEGQYKGHKDKYLHYRPKISENYEEKYFEALHNGKGFNPMDALEKNFKRFGLDKTEPELYAKIIKYRDILQEKELPKTRSKIPFVILGVTLTALTALAVGFQIYKNRDKQ